MLINTSASLKTRIARHWATSNPYEQAIKALQPILSPPSHTAEVCFLLYQVARGRVGTHRGKKGLSKESVAVLTTCKKPTQESARPHPGFLMALIQPATFTTGWLHPWLRVLRWLQCQSKGHVVEMTRNLLTDLWELTNPQNQKIFVIHLHSECSFHILLNKSCASEHLFQVQKSIISLLQKGA